MRLFRPGYAAHLVDEWLPALDGVVEKLRAGASVADVGCGLGASTIIMAEAFEQSTFVGFDIHEPSIVAAPHGGGGGGRRPAGEIRRRDRPGLPGPATTWCACSTACTTWVIRSGRPAASGQALAPDGTLLLVEPLAGDGLEDNLNPVGRIFYGLSTVICTPASLAQEVGLGLGAQAGELHLGIVLREAGFTRVRRATETPFNVILEAGP